MLVKKNKDDSIKYGFLKWAISCKWAKEGVTSKGVIERPKLKTYTRYSGVHDEKQKKKFLVFKDSILRNLIWGGHWTFKFILMGS